MPLERILMEYGEALQYAVYFGLLGALGLVETLTPGRAGAPARARRWPINFGLTLLNIVVLSALPVSGPRSRLLTERRPRRQSRNVRRIADVQPGSTLNCTGLPVVLCSRLSTFART